MYVIEPTPITDTIFTGSNVPENDDQEWVSGTAYATDDTVMVATSVSDTHKTYECVNAQSAGLTADLLNENCSDISDWTNVCSGTGVAEVSPVGQFKMLLASASDYASCIYRFVTPPNTFSLEMKLYFDNIGAASNDSFTLLWQNNSNWQLEALFRSDGLFIVKAAGATTEVGTNIVKCNTSACWQYYRFQVNKTTESTATVEVFLKEDGGTWVSQGTVDCDYEPATSGNVLQLTQNGHSLTNAMTHIDYIRIATGLGEIANTDVSPVGNTDWLETGSTNRWNCFNNVLGSQTEQATKIEYVLTPGAVIDSVALLNLDSDTVDIVEIDSADQLILNNDWTDATGTTQPTSWDKVGTPSDFTIDGDWLQITADANGEGISQTFDVVAETEYQLVLNYMDATANDDCQVAIYDMSNSADILATTDLTDTGDYVSGSSYSHVFTTPAGCTSIKVSLLCKTSGDVCLFAKPYCCPTEYSETVTTGASKTSVIKSDIPEIATGILTVTINKSGTAAIGELIIGNSFTLGTLRPKPQIGFRNLSTLDEDTFGNITIVSRGYKNKMVCGVIIPMASLDAVYKFLCDHKDDMMVYVGSETYSCLQLYGFSKEPQIVPDLVQADMSLEIWSVI